MMKAAGFLSGAGAGAYRWRRVLAGLVALAFAVAVATAMAAPAANAPPVPLLWKVSDQDNSVYLLGSFHLLTPQDYPLSSDVQGAFADAEALLFEIAPQEMFSPAFGLQMGQAGVRQEAGRLDDDLPPATRERLQAWLARNAPALARTGLTPDMLQRFKPWFVGLTVSVAEMTGQGLDPKLGLDTHLATQAAQQGKPTGGLETGAQQIAFFDSMDKADQIQFLDESLGAAEEGQEETRELHAAWRAGKADVLWNEMGMEMKQHYPRLYQRINVQRNQAWIPQIERRLAAPGSDDVLVVVGALHLLGPDGLIEGLRGKGYTIERVCASCAATETR